MMKKLLAVLMVGGLVAAFMAGCQPKDETTTGPEPAKMDQSNKAPASPSTSATTTPPATTEPVPGAQTTPNKSAPDTTK